MSHELNQLCLIGMSGVGKSYWSTQLEKLNYTRISCDDLIVTEILDHDPKETDPIAKLGPWLGYPWNDFFKEREAIYLQSEIKHMQNILDLEHETKTVIDSAGSLIYCPDNLLNKLQDKYTMIYLKLTPEKKNQLTHDYLVHPRPIVWSGRYVTSQDPEPLSQQFADQYLSLIKYREEQYQKYSDLEISSDKLETFQDPKDFINYLNERT